MLVDPSGPSGLSTTDLGILGDTPGDFPSLDMLRLWAKEATRRNTLPVVSLQCYAVEHVTLSLTLVPNS